MRDLEAKDFLVRQTAEQATLENVPLSELERRMMYFTETGECPEDPIALNDSFEAAYDATEYEAKISKAHASRISANQERKFGNCAKVEGSYETAFKRGSLPFDLRGR